VLHEIAAVLTKSASAEAKLQAGIELGAYLAGWIQKRTENPGADPISDITKATIDGRPYNAEEIMGTVALLLAAGLDTTASVMSFMTLYLARNPEQRRYVREHRDNLTPIVNEFLRRFPVPNDSRVATEDIEYGGVTIKEGERVYLLLPLYNLDENIFENPEEVDFSRNPRHISFGTGPHTCVAAALAQLEFKIFLDEWLEQIPDFEIDPADDSVALRASHNNAIDRLKLRWDVTQT
jgi:cytochrome P450